VGGRCSDQICGTILVFTWRAWRKSRKLSVIIKDIPARIRTGHFPNINHKPYRFSRPPSFLEWRNVKFAVTFLTVQRQCSIRVKALIPETLTANRLTPWNGFEMKRNSLRHAGYSLSWKQTALIVIWRRKGIIMIIFAHEVQGAVLLMNCLLYTTDLEARNSWKESGGFLSPSSCPLFQPCFLSQYPFDGFR
jgi:hypothetical protein